MNIEVDEILQEQQACFREDWSRTDYNYYNTPVHSGTIYLSNGIHVCTPALLTTGKHLTVCTG